MVRLGGDVGSISSLFTQVEFRNVEELLGNDIPLGLRAVEGELTHTLRTEEIQEILCLSQGFKSGGKRETETWRKQLLFFIRIVKKCCFFTLERSLLSEQTTPMHLVSIVSF